MGAGHCPTQSICDGVGVDFHRRMGGRENIAPHTMKVSELSAESKRCDSGDVTHLQHSELVSGGRKGESCSKRSGRCSLQDASRGHREIREATPKEDAIGV